MVVTYKCPNCGSSMEFDGESGKLVCDNCGTQLTVEEYAVRRSGGDEGEDREAAARAAEEEKAFESHSLGEDSYTRAEQTAGETIQVQIFRCPSCGAELMTDEHTVATICSYCGNPGLILDRVSGVQSPKAVLPFRITKEQAVERFLKWTRNGLLTPSDFTSKNTLEKITGMYVPYWLYDYRINVDMKARATRSHVTRRGDMEYTYTDHYQVYRSVDTEFEKIPVDASKRMDDKVMESLEPYDYQDLKEFEMGYLSGYVADKYDAGSEELQDRAKARAREAAIGVTRSTIGGYHTVQVMDQRVHIQEKQVDYVMMPVWVLNYRYQEKDYSFMLNGQTGKLHGKLPISKGKMAKWFGIISGVSFAAIMVISLVGGLF